MTCKCSLQVRICINKLNTRLLVERDLINMFMMALMTSLLNTKGKTVKQKSLCCIKGKGQINLKNFEESDVWSVNLTTAKPSTPRNKRFEECLPLHEAVWACFLCCTLMDLISPSWAGGLAGFRICSVLFCNTCEDL